MAVKQAPVRHPHRPHTKTVVATPSDIQGHGEKWPQSTCLNINRLLQAELLTQGALALTLRLIRIRRFARSVESGRKPYYLFKYHHQPFYSHSEQ
jgi:hypothetical protein